MVTFIKRKHSFFGSVFSMPLVKELGYYSRIPIIALNDHSKSWYHKKNRYLETSTIKIVKTSGEKAKFSIDKLRSSILKEVGLLCG